MADEMRNEVVCPMCTDTGYYAKDYLLYVFKTTTPAPRFAPYVTGYFTNIQAVGN